MSLKDFYKELSEGLVRPIYLITSQEEFLLHESLLLIKEKLQCANSLNYNQYDLDSSEDGVSIKELLVALNTPPFLGDRRIIVLKNMQKLLKKEIKKLGEYLLAPSDFSLLIMLCEGDHKKVFSSEMLKNTKVITMNISGNEINKWIKEKAKKRDIELTDGAIEYIINTVGDDLFMLNSEIEKISLSLIGKRIVDTFEIKEIVYEGIEFNSFDLTRALERGDKKSVFKIFCNLEKKIDLVIILGALNWHYKSLYDKATGKEKEKYLKIFKLLHETDIGIKSSQPNVVENLLIKILQIEQKLEKA